MVAYNFQARFADAVESGAKPHTIRADRKDGRVPKVGQQIHLYTGMRTKACRLLRKSIITEVARVQIRPGSLYVDGACLMSDEASQLARADGFDNAREFFDWFRVHHGHLFNGYLIRWEISDQARKAYLTKLAKTCRKNGGFE